MFLYKFIVFNVANVDTTAVDKTVYLIFYDCQDYLDNKDIMEHP